MEINTDALRIETAEKKAKEIIASAEKKAQQIIDNANKQGMTIINELSSKDPNIIRIKIIGNKTWQDTNIQFNDYRLEAGRLFWA